MRLRRTLTKAANAVAGIGGICVETSLKRLRLRWTRQLCPKCLLPDGCDAFVHFCAFLWPWLETTTYKPLANQLICNDSRRTWHAMSLQLSSLLPCFPRPKLLSLSCGVCGHSNWGYSHGKNKGSRRTTSAGALCICLAEIYYFISLATSASRASPCKPRDTITPLGSTIIMCGMPDMP